MGDDEYLTLLRSEYRRVLDDRTMTGRWHAAKSRLATSAGADARLCEHCCRPVGTHFSTIAPRTNPSAWRRGDWTWLALLSVVVLLLGWAFAAGLA